MKWLLVERVWFVRCYDTDLGAFQMKIYLVSMKKALLTYEKEKGLYQSKVTSSLTLTQRPGHQARNCKMGYSLRVICFS